MPRRIAYTYVARDKFTAISKRVKHSVGAVQRKFKGFSKTLKRTSERLRDVARKLRSVSLAAAGLGAASVKAFGDFEKGITNVFTLLDKDQLVQFEGDLTAVSKGAIAMGFSMEDVNKALFDNVSALGTSENSMEAFEVAQKLAIGGVADLSVAVDGITSIMNAYGKETTNSNVVANAFFTAQKAGKTTVDRLASTVGAVAPMAKSAGVGFQELLATMSQLTLGGLSTEESATALRGALTALLKPGAEAEKILTDLGVPFGASGLQASSLREALLKLTDVNIQIY
jgi:TP901 family phage tail tape measure protein